MSFHLSKPQVWNGQRHLCRQFLMHFRCSKYQDINDNKIHIRYRHHLMRCSKKKNVSHIILVNYMNPLYSLFPVRAHFIQIMIRKKLNRTFDLTQSQKDSSQDEETNYHIPVSAVGLYTLLPPPLQRRC